MNTAFVLNLTHTRISHPRIRSYTQRNPTPGHVHVMGATLPPNAITKHLQTSNKPMTK